MLEHLRTHLVSALPNLTRLWHAHAEHDDPRIAGVCFGAAVDRRLLAPCRQAGLEATVLQPYLLDSDYAHAGSEYFEYRYELFRGYLSLKSANPVLKSLPDAGILNLDIVKGAMADLERWHEHPDAIFVNNRMSAWGRVP